MLRFIGPIRKNINYARFLWFYYKKEALLPLKWYYNMNLDKQFLNGSQSKIMSLREFAIFMSKMPTVNCLQLLYLCNEKSYQGVQYLIFSPKNGIVPIISVINQIFFWGGAGKVKKKTFFRFYLKSAIKVLIELYTSGFFLNIHCLILHSVKETRGM